MFSKSSEPSMNGSFLLVFPITFPFIQCNHIHLLLDQPSSFHWKVACSFMEKNTYTDLFPVVKLQNSFGATI